MPLFLASQVCDMFVGILNGCWAGSGAGLGKNLQGMATKLEATANKGTAGLGLGQTHTLSMATTPDYSPKPDTAILTNDHAVLSFEELQWWRIMHQRKPAKLLRSKFLPQENILLALRSAREMSQTWHAQISVSHPAVPDQATSSSHEICGAEVDFGAKLEKPSPAFAEGDSAVVSPEAISTSAKATTSSSEAAVNSSAEFCLHQGPCVAPQGTQHSRSFWNMASLNSAFSLCSNLAANSSTASQPCILDLSDNDSGALEYILTRGGVNVHSAQVVAGSAAEKLKSTVSNAADVIHAIPSSRVAASACALPAAVAVSTPLTGTSIHAAQHDDPSAAHESCAAPLQQSATVNTSLTQSRDADETTGAAAMTDATAATDDVGTSNSSATGSSTQRISEEAAQFAYTFASYEAVKPHLRAAQLVVGSLNPADAQNLLHTTRDSSEVKGSNEGQGSGQQRQGTPAVGRADGKLGVMEAEYGRGYRKRLLWECTVALSCLQPGEPLPLATMHV